MLKLTYIRSGIAATIEYASTAHYYNPYLNAYKNIQELLVFYNCSSEH
ncbi:MAG: hypothetical protein ACTS73_04270 [Arsenophonus sp. NEOnobi-MAG3]